MSSSSDESDISTYERSRTDATIVPQNLLPAKSREKYLRVYNNFIAWKDAKGENSFSETVFLTYFHELAVSKRPSTLWSTYSMLKSTVSNNNDIKIETYSKLLSFLKRQARGYKSKKSKVFTGQDVETFLNEAPDDVFLAIKVALIFGIHGACRGRELLNITVGDIEKHSDQLLLVKLKDTKTKVDRSFIVREKYKNIVEKYLSLRPSDLETNRFFIRYSNGRCFKQVIGKNKICSMPQEIATYLNLPDPKLYTGHCFRRTSAVLLTPSGADLSDLNFHGSSIGTEGYTEDSIENKTQMSTCVVEIVKSEDSDDSRISTLSSRPSTSRPLAYSGTDLCDLKLNGGFNPDTVAEVYLDDCIQNKAQINSHILENIKLEPSIDPLVSTLSSRPSTSKPQELSFLHSGNGTYTLNLDKGKKFGTEEYLKEVNKEQTRKRVIENTKVEGSSIPPISPLSPGPSSSKQHASSPPQNLHISYRPDSMTITNTQTSTTINIQNKTVTITFPNSSNDTNTLNINF